MENVEHLEYWESPEPEVDFNEMNRTNLVTRFANTVIILYILVKQ